MRRRVRGRGQVAARVAILILAASNSGASSLELEKAGASDVETMARRLVGELLDVSVSRHRPPLTSDAEHARTIDPVLTRDAVLWVHEALTSPPLTVVGGRVFSYRDA